MNPLRSRLEQTTASRARRAALVAAALLLACGRLAAQELVFAPAAEARRLLATTDDFVARLSPFDRAARMKTDRDVAEPEYLEFAGSAALDWDARERSAVETAFRGIVPELERLRVPLPAQILVIKTSGKEEGGAAYTRGNAIVLPSTILVREAQTLDRLLAHELFHIVSRAHAELATALYATIGFRYCGEAAFPADLAARKLTNPDAPRNDHCIRLGIAGASVWATPILFARSARYDRALGGEFFDYLQLQFLLVGGPSDGAAPRASVAAGASQVVPLQRLSGFFEQVGRNTDYVIHPEEILADNFAMLVTGKGAVRSPEVLERIRNALAAAAPAR